jgi:hypothetical protein
MMETVWVSAGVAAAVTLAIEYLAKPSLEARKDRILEAWRNARRLRASVQHLYRSVIYLCSEPVWQGGLELVEAELDKCDTLNERITDLTVEAMHKIPQGLPERLIAATAFVKGATLRVRQGLGGAEPVEHHIERFRQVEPVIESCVQYFDVPRRRILERRRALSAIDTARARFADE